MFLVELALVAIIIGIAIGVSNGMMSEGYYLVCSILAIAFILILPGFKILRPQEALVFTLFGKYLLNNTIA